MTSNKPIFVQTPLTFFIEVSLIVFAVSAVFALDAHPLAASGGIKICSLQDMVSYAVCTFMVVSGWAVTPKSIFPWSYGLQMVWIYAAPVSAEVVYLKPFRNVPNEYLVGHPVSICAFASNTGTGITSLEKEACPIPALSNRIYVDVPEKSFPKDDPIAGFIRTPFRVIHRQMIPQIGPS